MSARDRASEYLLGELEPDAAARFEAELSEDPALAAEVERLRPIVDRLVALEPAAWELEAVDVPPLALPEPEAPARPRWWRRPVVVRPLAAAAALVLLALGAVAGVLLAGDGADEEGGGDRLVRLAPVEPLGAGAAGTASFDAAGERATVHLTGLEPSRDGEFYELWLLNSPEDLVSLGSFSVPASGEVDVTVPVPGDPDAFGALDVSVEPPDGNPAHSSKSVLRAPLSAS